MWKEIVGKLLKSELWVALAGIIAALLAPKMGIPQEQMLEFLTSLSAIVGLYIAGRSYAKPREIAAKNGNGVKVNP